MNPFKMKILLGSLLSFAALSSGAARADVLAHCTAGGAEDEMTDVSLSIQSYYGLDRGVATITAVNHGKHSDKLTTKAFLFEVNIPKRLDNLKSLDQIVSAKDSKEFSLKYNPHSSDETIEHNSFLIESEPLAKWIRKAGTDPRDIEVYCKLTGATD